MARNREQKPLKPSTLYSTNLMEAARESQSTNCRRSGAHIFPVVSVALALALGLMLRLWILKNFFFVDGDSLIYGELGKNLLQHGRYAFIGAGGVLDPTLIR